MLLLRNFILGMAMAAMTLAAPAPIPTNHRSNSWQREGSKSNYKHRTLMTGIHNQYTMAQMDKFRVLDVNGDSFITLDEWRTYCAGLGKGDNEEALRREFNSMDPDGNCCIDFTEMLPHMARKYKMGTVHKAASLVDKDYNGFISVPELMQFMAITYHNNFTNQQAEQVIRTWDSNRDGRLSANELAVNSVMHPK